MLKFPESFVFPSKNRLVNVISTETLQKSPQLPFILFLSRKKPWALNFRSSLIKCFYPRQQLKFIYVAINYTFYPHSVTKYTFFGAKISCSAHAMSIFDRNYILRSKNDINWMAESCLSFKCVFVLVSGGWS